MLNTPIKIGALLLKLTKKIGHIFLHLHDNITGAFRKLTHRKKRKSRKNFFKIPTVFLRSMEVLLFTLKVLNNLFNKSRLFFLGILLTILFMFVPYVVHSWFKELPSPDMLTIDQKYGATQILDRNGVLLYEIYADEKYEPVKLERIPENAVNATIAVEDSLFYIHRGLRPDSIIRAFRKTLFDGDTQGGSTITQQLVKNVL